MTPFWSEPDSSLLFDPEWITSLQFIFTLDLRLFHKYKNTTENENKCIQFPIPFDATTPTNFTKTNKRSPLTFVRLTRYYDNPNRRLCFNIKKGLAWQYAL